MVRIRSVTVFLHPGRAQPGTTWARGGALARQARAGLEQTGYAVQTLRWATPPLPAWVPEPAAWPRWAARLAAAAQAEGVDFVAVGPWPADRPATWDAIPEVLAAAGTVFAAGHLVDAQGRIHPAAARAGGQVIHQLAGQEPHGFANLRFAALAQVPPGTPFFPAAYAAATRPPGWLGLALAVETPALLHAVLDRAATWEAAFDALVAELEALARRLEQAVQPALAAAEAEWLGLDLSWAPFPTPRVSIAAAMERLGVPAVGLPGTLALAAWLTHALQVARFPRTGFNGLMLPVLEDATLAQRAAEGRLRVNDLLLYSAVCGVGPDTVPLPGEVPPQGLAALLLDVAALAVRLGKPLAARLMPIPGARAGDPLTFDFPYFAAGRVLAWEAADLTRWPQAPWPLAAHERVSAG